LVDTYLLTKDNLRRKNFVLDTSKLPYPFYNHYEEITYYFMFWCEFL